MQIMLIMTDVMRINVSQWGWLRRGFQSSWTDARSLKLEGDGRQSTVILVFP